MEHAAEAVLLAGAGKAEVELGNILPFDGFDAARHPLAARALVLEDTVRICVVSIELTSIRTDLLEALRAQAERASGTEGPALWVVATHTFSAPHVRTAGHLASDDLRRRNDALRTAYEKAVFEAVTQAMESRQPARLLLASGTTSVMVNRDVETARGWWLGKDPDGPSDGRLFVLSAQTPGGESIATVFSADVQSSVLKDSRDSQGQRVVSGDLAGAAAASLERAGAGIALFIEGCAADQAPRETACTTEFAPDGSVLTTDVHDGGYRMLHLLGTELAQDVADALGRLSPVPGEGLGASAEEVLLPGKEREDFAALAPRRSIVWRESAPLATTMSFLRIGSCVLVGLEPEVSSSFGAHLRDAEGGPSAVFTMVNGAQKYLADEEDFDLITYEAMNSGFGREAASLLQEAVLRGTKRMRRRRMRMKVGCARRDITPEGDIYLIGYRDLPNRLEPATAVHDDVFANALLFQDGERELFVLSADVLEFEEEMAEDVKTLLSGRYGIDRDCVLLSATHDHTSICAYHRSWWTHKFDQHYYDWLLDAICSCFEECRENAREATAKVGSQIVTGFYGNRNVPGRLADNEVIVCEFADEAGVPFAGIVNWAVHSAVVGPDCTELTSELAGLVSKKLEPALGYFPAMIVGAAGDCSDRNFRQGRGIEEVERVSDGLAASIAEIRPEREVPLSRIEVQTAYHTVAHDDFHLDLKLEVISLGGLHLFVFPSELGGDFGIRMRRECPVQGLVFGYTNGYFEYFFPAWEYGLSFETEHTQIPKGEPEKIVDKFCQASKLLGAFDAVQDR